MGRGALTTGQGLHLLEKMGAHLRCSGGGGGFSRLFCVVCCTQQHENSSQVDPNLRT